MNPPHADQLDRLLAEGRWIRRLAGTLVIDPHDADDLAQDACALALDHPPGHTANLRAWLRTVMQSLLRQRHRATARRERREDWFRRQRPTVADGADELVERAAMHRAIVDAVLTLPAQFREAVLLRYFEDLPPRRIAAHLAIPVATVHSRLQRAHGLLRRALDRQLGRERWLCALLPLTGPVFAGPTLAGLSAGITAMNVKLLSAAAALLLAGTAALWFRQPDAPVAPTTTTTSTSLTPPTRPATTAATADPDDPNHARREAVTAPPPENPAPTLAARAGGGRVVDAEGRALAGLTLRVGEVTTHSAVDGSFEFRTTERGTLRARADDAAWQTVMEGVVQPGDAPPPNLVVAAPALHLGGIVRDSRGEVPAGVQVRVVLPEALRARLSDVADRSVEATFETRLAADGSFRLAAAAVRGAELLTIGDGCSPDRRPLPDHDQDGLSIVLTRLDEQPGTVRGQVVDPHGRAVAGAHIGLGRATTSSDSDGNFAVVDDGKGRDLCGSAPGHRRGVVTRAGAFPPFVLLTLGAEPMTIRGRVVDEQGTGIAGVAVWPADGTALCDGGEPLVVEGIALGYPSLAQLRERFERGEFAGRRPDEVMRDNPTVAWPRVRTGADGSFVLGGLEDRAYTLRVMDEATLQMIERSAVPAGSDGVRCVLDRSELFERVAGVCATRAGDPVAGVRVTLMLDAQRVNGSTMHAGGTSHSVTDEQGRFEFARVPRQHAYLRLDGDAILPMEPGRGLPGGLGELAGGNPERLRIEVPVRMHVQVELLDPTQADQVTVLDDDDRTLQLNVFRGNGRRTTECLPLTEGRSPVFVVPDRARTLVLHKGEAEVRREILQLRVGEVNTLRL